jgi:hypothetical protein
VHHRTIQINHQPDATVFQFFIIRKLVYSLTCFGRFPAHHQELDDCSGSLWFYLHIVVPFVLCWRSARPPTKHDWCVIVRVLMTLMKLKMSSYICIHSLLFQLVFLYLLLRNLKAKKLKKNTYLESVYLAIIETTLKAVTPL